MLWRTPEFIRPKKADPDPQYIKIAKCWSVFSGKLTMVNKNHQRPFSSGIFSYKLGNFL